MSIEQNLERVFGALPSADYVEPPSVTELLDEVTAALRSGPDDLLLAAQHAIARVITLERALMPFAVHGATLLQVKSALAVAKSDEPAGGVWFSDCRGSVEVVERVEPFVEAVDALGRDRTKSQLFRDVAAHRAMAERAEATSH